MSAIAKDLGDARQVGSSRHSVRSRDVARLNKTDDEGCFVFMVWLLFIIIVFVDAAAGGGIQPLQFMHASLRRGDFQSPASGGIPL